MTDDVLKEFLVKLGYQVDTLSQAKFAGSVGLMTSKVLSLAKGAIGVTVAVEAMVLGFSHSMEKLFYASQLTGDSAGNLQAFARAAKQIGIDGDAALNFVKQFTIALKNPGLQTMMIGMGVKGNNPTEQFFSYIDKLNQMPDIIAMGKAQADIGLGSEDYLMLKAGLPKMKREYAAEQQRQKDSGTNVGEQARKLTEFNNELAKLADTFYSLGVELAASDGVLNSLKQLTQLLERMARIAGLKPASTDTIKKLNPGAEVREVEGGHVIVKKRKENLAGQTMRPGVKYGTHATQSSSPSSSPSSQGPKSDLEIMSRVEEKFGLPKGLLARLRKAESAGGTQLRIKGAGKNAASGHFMFIPSTGKRYGLNKQEDFDDLEKSSNAAGNYLSDIFKRRKDWSKSLDEYGGWGAKGASQSKRQWYKNTILGDSARSSGGVVQHNNTDIKVYGTGSAEDTGKAVGREQNRVFADAARNLGGRAQ